MLVKKRFIICFCIILFAFGMNTPPIISVSDNVNEEREPTIFGDLTEIPNTVGEQFIYFRDLILNEFGVSLETFLSYDENTTKLIHKYTFAFMGYENGTLTRDEVEEMTKHNTPTAWWGILLWPLQGDFRSRTDELFKFYFFSKAGVPVAERIKQIDVYLDRDGNPLSPFSESASTVMHLNLEEDYDFWNFGYVSGKSWIAPGPDGGIWGADGVGLFAYGSPGYIDNWVKVVIKYQWQTWGLFTGWSWETPVYMKINTMDLPIIGPRILIYDDDTDPPYMASYPQIPNINFQFLDLDFGDGTTQVLFDGDVVGLGGRNLNNIKLKFWIWDTSGAEIRFKVNGQYTSWYPVPTYYLISQSLGTLLTSPFIKVFHITIEIRDKDNDRPEDFLSSQISFTLTKAVPYTRPVLSNKVRIQMRAHNVMELYQGIDFNQYPDPDLFVAYKDENNNKGWFEPLVSVINPKNDRPVRITIKHTQKILHNRLDMVIKALGWTVTTDPNLSHVRYYTRELTADQKLNDIPFFRTTITNTRVLKEAWEYITRDVIDYAAFAVEGFIMKEWPWSKGLTITAQQKKAAYAVGFIDFGKDIYQLISGLLALDRTNCPIHQFELQVQQVVIPKFQNPDGNWNWTEADILNRDLLNQNNDLVGLAELNGMMTWAGKAPDDNKFSFTALFIPTQDQVAWAIAFLATELINDGLMLGSTIAFKEGYWKAGIWLFVFAVIADFVKYAFHHMANEVDPPNPNYNEKSTPDKLELNPDIKQQLIDSGDEDIVEVVEELYEFERYFYGYQQSYDKYITALNNNDKEAAANQLQWGLEYMEEANDIIPNLSKKLSQGLSKSVDTMNQLGIDFDANDAPDMSNFVLNDTAKDIIEYHRNNRPEWNIQTPAEYENNYRQLNGSSWEVEEKLMKSTVIQKNLLELVMDETANDFTTKYVGLKKELGNPVIINNTVRSELEAQLLAAETAFTDGDYFLCIEIASQLEEFARTWYLKTLDEFFDEINWKANSLKIMALSVNQIHAISIGDNIKEVKNGESVEFDYQVYNEVNNHINPDGNQLTVEPIIEVKAKTTNGIIPNGIIISILDENGNALPTSNGAPILKLENKEVRNIKIKIDIIKDSPYELQDFDFILLIHQEIGSIKSIELKQDFSITILDDDTTSPEIEIEYINGDYTDANPGQWVVSASDPESGISEMSVFIDEVLVGTSSGLYAVPNDLNIHNIKITAKNGDLDRGTSDQEISIKTHMVSIVDDDTQPPEIVIEWFGQGTDGNPGVFEWAIFDSDDGIGGDQDTGFSNVSISVKYQSTEGLDDYIFIIPVTLKGDQYGNWYLPSALGIYTLNIYARDNDDDRTIAKDSLDSSATLSVTIIDDDIIAPEINDFLIQQTLETITVSFTAIDENSGFIDDLGLSMIKIFIDNIKIIEYYPTPVESFFNYSIPNEWIMGLGVHNVRVEVWDADNDRIGDSSYTAIEGTFETSLEEMYNYVISSIEILRTYVENYLSSYLGRSIQRKLEKASDHLAEAYSLIIEGYVTCGLVHDLIAQALAQVSEFQTALFNRIGFISDEDAKYIIPRLREIRNNIVILMGSSIDSPQAYEIALIAVDLLTLKDYIKEEIGFFNRICVTNALSCAISLLELSILKLSLDLEVNVALIHAQEKLDFAIIKVNSLLDQGKISGELAEYLVFHLQDAIDRIELLP